MALHLTPEKRKKYEEFLTKAKPYSDEELNAIGFDGKYDEDRMRATDAEVILGIKKIPPPLLPPIVNPKFAPNRQPKKEADPS